MSHGTMGISKICSIGNKMDVSIRNHLSSSPEIERNLEGSGQIVYFRNIIEGFQKDFDPDLSRKTGDLIQVK